MERTPGTGIHRIHRARLSMTEHSPGNLNGGYSKARCQCAGMLRAASDPVICDSVEPRAPLCPCQWCDTAPRFDTKPSAVQFSVRSRCGAAGTFQQGFEFSRLRPEQTFTQQNLDCPTASARVVGQTVCNRRTPSRSPWSCGAPTKQMLRTPASQVGLRQCWHRQAVHRSPSLRGAAPFPAAGPGIPAAAASRD